MDSLVDAGSTVAVGASVGTSVAVGGLVDDAVGMGVLVGGMAVIVITSAAHSVAPISGVGIGVAVAVTVSASVGEGNHVGVIVNVGTGTCVGVVGVKFSTTNDVAQVNSNSGNMSKAFMNSIFSHTFLHSSRCFSSGAYYWPHLSDNGDDP